MNLILLGHIRSLTRNSKVKKTMTKLSVISMMKTTTGHSISPVSSTWSSSAVEMMKVMVEMMTMEREKSARNWASLEVQGYSIVFHIQLRHSPSLLPPKSSSSACSSALFLASRSPSFSLWQTSSSGKYLRAQQGSMFISSTPQY